MKQTDRGTRLPDRSTKLTGGGEEGWGGFSPAVRLVTETVSRFGLAVTD